MNATDQSLKSINDNGNDDGIGLLKISNILNVETIEMAAVQSHEKYLNQSINKIRDNVAFQEKLLKVQINNTLDHECLEQLNFIFERSMMSVTNHAHHEQILNDKINTKQNSNDKLSKVFLDEFNAMSNKYEQLRERKQSRCEFNLKMIEKESTLQSDMNLLKSLQDMILTEKQKKNKAINEKKRIAQIVVVKFATLMQMANRENAARRQLVENKVMLKHLKERKNELQEQYIAKQTRNNVAESASNDNGIPKKFLLPSMSSTTYNSVRLFSIESQYSAKHFTNKVLSKANSSITKLNRSFTNHDLFSKLPFLKNIKSGNIAATTSKYFESSRIYLKSSGKKQPSTQDVSVTEAGDADNKIVNTSNKEFGFDCEQESNNLAKRVKFSSDINRNGAKKKDIIIIREDIVRSSIQSKATTPLSSQENNTVVSEINDEQIDSYNTEYGNNFAYLDSGSQYLSNDDDVNQIELFENDNQKNSNDEIENQGIFSFNLT